MSDQANPEHDPIYTVDEVAQACRVTRRSVYRWIEKGALVVVKLPGDQIRICQSALDALKLPHPHTPEQ